MTKRNRQSSTKHWKSYIAKEDRQHNGQKKQTMLYKHWKSYIAKEDRQYNGQKKQTMLYKTLLLAIVLSVFFSYV
jgi:competence protein ComGF